MRWRAGKEAPVVGVDAAAAFVATLATVASTGSPVRVTAGIVAGAHAAAKRIDPQTTIAPARVRRTWAGANARPCAARLEQCKHSWIREIEWMKWINRLAFNRPPPLK